MNIQDIFRGIADDGLTARIKGVPRVSTVIRPSKNGSGSTGGNTDAMKLGTKVHKLIEESIDSGELYDTAEEDAAGYVESFNYYWDCFKPLHQDYEFATEIPVGDAALPMRGTIDFLAGRQYKFNGEVKRDFLLCDWKTGMKHYSSYPTQLAAYKLLVSRSLQKRGINDFTLNTLAVKFDKEGGDATTISCHQSDLLRVKELILAWKLRYDEDEAYAWEHDDRIAKSLSYEGKNKWG